MRSRRVLIPIIVAIVFTFALVVAPAGAAPALSGGSFTRSISSGGTTSFAAAAPSLAGGVEYPEFATGEEGDTEGGDADADDSHHGVDRSLSGPTTGNGRPVN